MLLATIAFVWIGLAVTVGFVALLALRAGSGMFKDLKEMVYVAVSATNGCEYCTFSHTAAARKRGMTDAMLMELMAVVGLANQTNRLANGLRPPVDKAFIAPA